MAFKFYELFLSFLQTHASNFALIFFILLRSQMLFSSFSSWFHHRGAHYIELMTLLLMQFDIYLLNAYISVLQMVLLKFHIYFMSTLKKITTINSRYFVALFYDGYFLFLFIPYLWRPFLIKMECYLTHLNCFVGKEEGTFLWWIIHWLMNQSKLALEVVILTYNSSFSGIINSKGLNSLNPILLSSSK